MTTQPGGYAPATVIQGEVITPSAVLDPKSMPAHNFAEVIRHLISRVPGVYKAEADMQTALDAVDAFERSFVPMQDRKHVVQETDMAGREDVSKRIPPRTGYAPVPAAGPAIDYNALAKAILAAQQQMQAESQPPAPVQQPQQQGGYQ